MPDTNAPPRPIGITLTSFLLVAFFLADFGLIFCDELRHAFRPAHSYTRIIAISLLCSLLMKGASVTAVFFFWRGMEWALWFVMLTSVFSLMMAAFFLPVGGVHIQDFPLTMAHVLLALFLLIYLNLPSIRAWFH